MPTWLSLSLVDWPWACAGYGRSTRDVNLLIDEREIAAAVTALRHLGFEIGARTEETVHLSGLGFLDILVARRAPTRQMLADATIDAELGVKVVRVEDIIGLKIQAYFNDARRKWRDRADIAELIRANPDMNWQRVMSYARLFEVNEELEAIRADVLE